MSAPQDEVREKFEKWVSAMEPQYATSNLERLSSGGYRVYNVACWWFVWQAASAELASLTQQIEELKRERDVAIAKLELLNSFYASDADETENEKLSRATKSLVAAERQVSELKEALRKAENQKSERKVTENENANDSN